ncbi:MAG: hypothetical protein QXF25_02685 [Candidatus Pacearchaeota archaeon]
MQQKIFDLLIKNVFGKQAGELVSFLVGKKDVNEFLIAKKLALTPNQVRNILYKFSHLGFTSFIKKKDRRKGWYTYFWAIDIIKLLDYIKKELEKEITEFEEKLKSRENKRFYICPNCKVEVSEESALLCNFTCPECGNIYELSYGEKATNELKNRLRILTQQLSIVNEELSKFEEEKRKKEERRRKKEEKMKKKAKKMKKVQCKKRVKSKKTKKKNKKIEKKTKKKKKR